MKNILVLYSTTDGHTLTICKRIKNYLNQIANINLISLINCKKEELENYDIIIIGASIRYGKHNPKVKEFVINNIQLLKNKQNAF